MSGILIITEDKHKMSRETVAAGQQIGASLGLPVTAAAIGGNTAELAACKLDKVYDVQHELLASYTADGFTAALAELIAKVQPKLVLFPHTYQVRDYAPKLATRLGQALISDVVRVKLENGAPLFVRQLFQGKINADVKPAGNGPHFASLQAGAYRGDQVEAGSAPVEVFTPSLTKDMIRSTPEAPFRESQRAVDLTAAEMIVSVGRGIKEKENIALAEQLAQALGAEIAASRPICDNGWLPMERQVGSSGQTVAPKVYFAVGISGAIQHLVGMKGAKTIVAINRDPDAPIFEVADYGLCADLFEVLPALTEEVKKTKN